MSPHSYILFAPFNSESGRTDVVNTINDFVFTPASKSAFENFTIVDDSVLEFDELFIAEFNFGPGIATDWNAKMGEPSTAFILIIDDDCELCVVIVQCPNNAFVLYFQYLFHASKWQLPSAHLVKLFRC